MKNLAAKIRPKTFSSIVGNEETVASIKSLLKQKTFPSTLMLTGESGTGKTTLARIIANKLNADLVEFNCADIRGMDDFREIIRDMSINTISGNKRVLILDEVHQLPKATQDLLLKPLEDGSSCTITILCTTNPEKLKKTIRTRATAFSCSLLTDAELILVLKRACKLTKTKVSDKVLAKIADKANGSARMALTIFESLSGLSEKEMLKRLLSMKDGEYDTAIIDLCRKLMNKSTKWKAIVEIVGELKEEPESIRYAVLGYATACMKNERTVHNAYIVANAFRDNFYDSGKAGLMLACYEAYFGQK